MPLAFALLFHAHQPAGNFDEVVETAFRAAYAPLLEALAARPQVRFNLHCSGYLLDWLAARHPEYIQRLRALARRGQMEVLGGGYYEPILASLRPADRRGQLDRLSARLERLLGLRPRGLWLAERVWQPDLAADLAAAGFDYTVLDDAHFLLAGLDPADLHGSFVTEAEGLRLRLVPSSLYLRQAIPFQPEGRAIDFLARAAVEHPGSLLCMGDDLEKFGSWPHTHAHVFEQGWLARFLDRLQARPEIETVRLSAYLDRHPPRRLVYLPTASYPEMMQWALPPAAGARFEAALAEPATEPYRRFLAGAPWMAFLARYGEANLLHKTQLELSRGLQRWREEHADAPGAAEAVYAAALDHLYAAQSNDAYWHGWFGGLYAPHLRNHLFERLLRADAALEELAGAPALRRFDLDGDGRDEIEMRNGTLRALLTPADGGTLAELDYRPAHANLVNSLQRREETCHRHIRERVAANPAGLPGFQPATFAELERRLVYDPWPRSGGRLHLLAADCDLSEFERDGGDAQAAGGEYEIAAALPGLVALRGRGGDGALVEKSYRLLEPSPDGRARLEIRCRVAGLGDRRLGLELVFNLLAATAPDRGIRHRDGVSRLRHRGALAGSELELFDRWRGLTLALQAPGADAWWVLPIETVSQSESGFETLYQGSSLTAIWPPGTAEIAVTVAARSLAAAESGPAH